MQSVKADKITQFSSFVVLAPDDGLERHMRIIFRKCHFILKFYQLTAKNVPLSSRKSSLTCLNALS